MKLRLRLHLARVHDVKTTTAVIMSRVRREDRKQGRRPDLSLHQNSGRNQEMNRDLNRVPNHSLNHDLSRDRRLHPNLARSRDLIRLRRRHHEMSQSRNQPRRQRANVTKLNLSVRLDPARDKKRAGQF